MRHSKRKRLTTNDVNRALRLLDAQPVYGHEAAANPANAGYVAVPEADVYVEDEDDCVDLAQVALGGDADPATSDGGGLSLQGREGEAGCLGGSSR